MVYVAVVPLCMHATHMMAAFVNAVYVTAHLDKCQWLCTVHAL